MPCRDISLIMSCERSLKEHFAQLFVSFVWVTVPRLTFVVEMISVEQYQSTVGHYVPIAQHITNMHMVGREIDPNELYDMYIHTLHKELTISETTESTSVASYLDLLFTRDRSNNITTKLYDKRDAFGFHIVNFPFMSSNIPSAPAYGVYASQLVRYASCCSSYSDFLIRHRALVKRLLSQGYKVNRLSNTFKKFYGRHTDLVGQYKKNVCQMFADSIS